MDARSHFLIAPVFYGRVAITSRIRRFTTNADVTTCLELRDLQISRMRRRANRSGGGAARVRSRLGPQPGEKILPFEKLVGFLETENPTSRETGRISRKLVGFLEDGKSYQSTGRIFRVVPFLFPDTPCRKRRDNVADTTFQDTRRRDDMFKTRRSTNLSQTTTRKSNRRRSCARPKSNEPIP